MYSFGDAFPPVVMRLHVCLLWSSSFLAKMISDGEIHGFAGRILRFGRLQLCAMHIHLCVLAEVKTTAGRALPPAIVRPR